jgi:glutaredoxin 3
MTRVKVFSTASCPFCVKAKQLLDKWNIPYVEAMIDSDEQARKEFAVATNRARTVPQIIIDGECIGGFTELTELHMEDKLAHLMEPQQGAANRH